MRFRCADVSRVLGSLLAGFALLTAVEAHAQSSSCPPGQYGIVVMTWPSTLYNCQPCPPGYFSPGGTVTSCTACAKGYYQPSMAQPLCNPSNPGLYVPVTASTMPSTCPPNTASSYAAALCSPCPTGYTSPSGSSSCRSATGAVWSPPPPPTPTPAVPTPTAPPTPVPPTATPIQPTATPNPPPVAPAAPTGLSAAQTSDTSITVTWVASTGATSYTVVYSKTSGGPWAPAGSTPGTSFTMQALSPGVTYYFAVSASNPYGQSPLSAQVARKILLM
jgi:hypothetical protein